VIELTENNVSELSQGDKTLVIDFWAPWCTACKSFSPVFEEASKDSSFSTMVFVKCNVEEFPELAVSFGVRSIPTVHFSKNAKKIHTQSGFMDIATFKNLLTKIKG
jgi:thioredoxin